ncbi:MAG: ABC transporter ATP-binding protein [Bacillota bacterium]
MDAIMVSGLTKVYGSLRAVDGIGFSVARGEVFGMLGPNGAGKTTTTEILAGLRHRDSGDVRVLGLDPGRAGNVLKTRISIQLQSAALYPRLTVLETVRLFASFYPDSLNPVIVLEQVGLRSSTRVLTSKLSGGQLQRLAIATSLVGNGELLFLDEPTTGLDPQARRALWQVITGLKDQGKTVFLTTHYMDEAERLCDRVAVVDNGRIIALGAPRALIHDHFRERAVEFADPTGIAANIDLTRLPGVTRMERHHQTVTLYTTEVTATVENLLAKAGGNGSAIDEFNVRQATLEDLFLKLTGRRIRE